MRRKIDDELGVTSLTPIAPIDIRLTRWKTETGEKIHFRNIDAATDYEGLKDVIECLPDTIINFADNAPRLFDEICHSQDLHNSKQSWLE